MKAKIVTGYARVSTDKEDQLNSLENQKSYFNREIEKSGYILYPIYYDEGLTGTKLDNRNGFNRMIYDAGIDVKTVNTNPSDGRKKFIHTVYEASERKPKFDEIWIKNTSRFARNTLSSEIIDKLREKHVNVHFIEQNIDTNDESKDFMLKLFQTFDENDSKDKSIKVRTGILESVKRGRIRASSKLYGYEYTQSENKLKIIPEEAEVVRTIFNLYANGFGIRKIIQTLTDSGITTRNKKPFCKNAISRILSNEKYAGLNNALKYDTGVVFHKNTYPKVKEHYEVSKSDKIPEIVELELFNKCKDIMKSKVNHQNQRGLYKGKSKYCGLVYCGKCGSVYHSNQDHGRLFYNCSNKKLHGLKACNNPNINEKAIDDYIQNLADYDAYNIIDRQKYDSVSIIYNVLRLKFDQIDSNRTEEANVIVKQIEEKQEILDGYEDLYALNKNDRGRLKSKIENLNDEISNLQQLYKDASKDNDAIIQDIVKLYDLYISIEGMDRGKEQYSIEEVMGMIDRIYIFDNEVTGKVSLYAPLAKAAELDRLVEEYKHITDFKPLTHEEIQYINDKLETVIDFS